MAQSTRLLLLSICSWLLLCSSSHPLVRCTATCATTAHKPVAKQVYSSVNSLVKAKKLSILSAALKAAKLGYNFESSSTRAFKGTLFLPSNAAFRSLLRNFNATEGSLLGNRSMLTSLLKYHIISGRSIYTKNLKGSISLQTEEGSNVTIRNENAVFSVTGVTPDNSIKIGSTKDYKAGKAAVHIIGDVLLPPAPPPRYINITAALANNTQLSSMLAAVQAAKLDILLSNTSSKLTVFAPSNDAFVSALGALGLTLGDLLINQPLLLGVLTHNIVMNQTLWAELPSLWMYNEPRTLLQNGMKLSMADLQSTTVSKLANGKLVVNGGINTATVVEADITAGAGILYVMDAVLLPASP